MTAQEVVQKRIDYYRKAALNSDFPDVMENLAVMYEAVLAEINALPPTDEYVRWWNEGVEAAIAALPKPGDVVRYNGTTKVESQEDYYEVAVTMLKKVRHD